MAMARGRGSRRGAKVMVAHLKLLIAKLRQDRFGASSERGRKMLDQMEIELEEMEAAASEAAAQVEAADQDAVSGLTRRRRRIGDHSPSRLQELLPRNWHAATQAIAAA